MNAYSKANSTIEPLTVFGGHTSVVGVRSASQNAVVYEIDAARQRMLIGMHRMRTCLLA